MSGKKEQICNEIYSYLEKTYAELQGFEHSPDREILIKNIKSHFLEIKENWTLFERDDLAQEADKSINLLNFMQMEQDPFESEFVKDLLSTIEAFFRIVKTCRVPSVKEPQMLDNETKEFINSFIVEATDLLDEVEPCIDDLGIDDNEESVNKIFRLFHSLKGLAGFLNFETVKSVTHEAETLLDIFRKNPQKQGDDKIDLIYRVCDFLRLLVQNVITTFSDLGYENDAAQLVQDIKKMIKKVENNIDSSEECESIISEDMFDKYIEESNELLAKCEEILLKLENQRDSQDLINLFFRNIHSLKGNSGFMGLKDIEEISMALETIFDLIRGKEKEISENLVSYILKIIDILRNTINSMKYAELAFFEVSQKEEIMRELEKICSDDDDYKLLGEILIEMGVEEETVTKALEKQNSINKKNDAIANENAKQDIRVNTNKLDKLFNLVGELITTEAMLLNNPELKELDLPQFTKSASLLNKITRELQEVTMSIRMMPLDGLFNKMKRLVRDVSKKSKKQINFSLSGQDTEMDKNIIEEISDPLVHILRNAIDHGIESENERLTRQKSKKGNVELIAKYEGNEILIVVRDDGKGLNKEKILKKALEKEIIRESELENFADQDVWQIIFAPGFSTADKVSDISGRGVGMDVVKKNIEKLRGRITVESKENEGSVFTLRIPLTLAIMDGMLVQIGETVYSIPILSIRQSFRPKKSDITITPDMQEIVKIREELLPVIRLHNVFKKKSDNKSLDEGILIAVEFRKKKACLFVDDILGQQQIVVKGLSDYIGKVHGITGSMVLGNGEVGLIVDLNSILDEV